MVEPAVSWPSLSLSSTAMRAMLFACRPCGWPQPAITSSTLAGSTSGLRSRTWSMTYARVSSGRSEASEPFRARPIGVRIASTMTASGMTTSFR